jgi:tetratricopeptide (TPR) repeat protein
MSDYPEVGSLLRQASELLTAGKDAEADLLYERILNFDAAQKEARLRRIVIAQRAARHEDVLALIDTAVRTDPSNPQWLVGRGLALSELERHDEALRAFDDAIALRDDYADAWFGKAQLLLSLGRYKEGWELFEWRFYVSDYPGESRLLLQPMWEGSGFHGQMLLIHTEQGVADTIQFYRFVAMARGFGGVIVEAPAELARLFASQPQAPLIIPRGQPLPGFDLQCSMMSLPLVLGVELYSVPGAAYLQADPALSAEWANYLPPRDGRPRIGIAWAKNPGNPGAARHNIPLPLLLETLGTEVVVVSLQTEMPVADFASLRAASQVVGVEKELQDFADIAAIVNQLDLVISVDTEAAHLAGAMGHPTWILLSAAAEWRWLTRRADSPWYPTARLFRQTQPDDWSSVMRAVSEALRVLGPGPVRGST